MGLIVLGLCLLLVTGICFYSFAAYIIGDSAAWVGFLFFGLAVAWVTFMTIQSGVEDIAEERAKTKQKK